MHKKAEYEFDRQAANVVLWVVGAIGAAFLGGLILFVLSY